MKTLYLHRHAKSSWDHPGLSDFERPLNERGLRDAPEMGRRLKLRGDLPDGMVSSPANRAHTTARLVADAIGFPEKDIVRVDRLYLPSVSTILSVVNALNDKHNTVMLFGHNPGFTEAVGYLSGNDLQNLPTAGVARIDFPFDEWKLVSAQTGVCRYVDFPKRTFEGNSFP